MFEEATEDLPYFSSAGHRGSSQRTTSVDEADLPTLKRIVERFEEKIAFRLSTDSLFLQDDTFTIEQQLAINQQLVADLREIKMLVQAAIDAVEEL